MPTTTRDGRAPLTAAQQELAEKYLPLARGLARPFKLGWPALRDEFEGAACLALAESAGAFDPDRGVRFSTFARHRIWGALLDVRRAEVALGWRCDPKHAPIVGGLPPDPEGRGRVLGAERAEAIGKELEDLEAVESWLRRLPTRHARACRQIYVHGKSQSEAAEIVGCSQSRLSYIHRESMAMLNGSWDAQAMGQDGASA